MSDLHSLISELQSIPQDRLHGLNVEDLVSTVTKLDAEARKITESKQELMRLRNKLRNLGERRR